MWVFEMVCWYVCRSIGNIMEFTQADRQHLDKSKQDTGSLGNTDDALKYDSGRVAHDFSCIHSKGTANTLMKGWRNVWASPCSTTTFFEKQYKPALWHCGCFFQFDTKCKECFDWNMFRLQVPNSSTFCVVWHSIIYSNIVPMERNYIMYNFHSRRVNSNYFRTLLKVFTFSNVECKLNHRTVLQLLWIQAAVEKSDKELLEHKLYPSCIDWQLNLLMSCWVRKCLQLHCT